MLDSLGGRFKDYAPFVLRLGLGIVFLYHGSQKLFGLFGGPGLTAFSGFIGHLGLHPPMLWAVLAAVAEFLGGLFVLLGFMTRYAAGGLVCVMLVAVVTAHRWQVFSKPEAELAFACLAMSTALFFLGGGELSLDLKRRRKKERT